MKKLIVFFFLILAGWVIFTLYRQRQEPDLAEEYRYAIDNAADVVQIKINYRLMDPDIVLEKEKGAWRLNGKYKVRPDAIDNLLNAIEHLELQYIPTAAARTNMMRDLASTGTKVELLDAQNQLLKSYFIGGNTPDESGSYIIMAGSNSPAIATISGFTGSIRPYFIMPEIEWRDRTVFSEPYDNISEIVVEYPGRESSSFVIREQDGAFRAYPLSDNIDVSHRSPRAGALEAYLLHYKKISAEAIIEDPALLANLSRKTPFSQITIRRKDASEYRTAFYPLALDNEDSRPLVERYHLIDNQGNLYLVQHLLFGKLFVDLENFFE